MTRIGRLSPAWKRRVLLLLACVTSLVIVAIAEVMAQEADTASAQAEDITIIDRNDLRLLAAPARAVSADTAEPVQVDFRITGVPAPEAIPEESDEAGDDPETAQSRPASPAVPLTSLADVTFRGYTRFVSPDTGTDGADEGTPTDAPTWGQVIITGLERGGRRARLDGFDATWELPEDAAGLEAGKPLVIEGNGDALTAALAALDAPEDEAADDEPELRVSGGGAPATETVGQPGGGGEKSDYRTPEPVKTTTDKASEKPPERKTVETTAGCDVRVDTDLEVVFQQIRDRVTADGKIVSQTDCYDSYKPEGRFALKKSYASCPVAVDEAAARVTSRYQFYYTDAKDAMRIVGNCVEDPDLTFDIVEDHASCPVAVGDGKATPQAAKTYVNRAGRKVVVRGCAPSESRQAVDLVKATGECNIRHDMKEGRSVVRGVDTYTLGGVTHQVGVCADTDTVFAHETDFEGCSVDIDLPGRLVTARSRIIWRDGGNEVVEVRGCRPDSGRTWQITEDAAGCDVVIDYAAGTATPQAKLVWLDADRRRVEARGCAPATGTRPVSLTADSAACSMRHDFAGRRTHERATYRYRLNGGSYTAATCRETGRSFALVKDYAACEAQIEARVGGRVVTKFRWSWTDTGNEKRFAGDCTADIDIRAGIVEDFASCNVQVDYDTGMATPQARLVYNDRNGQTIEIAACRVSVGKPAVKLVADTGDCEATIDLKAGSVAETASYSYRLDNEVRRASDCRATGRTFDLARDHASCETLIDLDDRTATDRFRMVYRDGAGQEQIAADCAPDPARRFAITEAFAGCDVAVDYAAATATPQAKLIYQDASRRRVEVRDCAPATTKRAVSLVADKSACEMRRDLTEKRIFETATFSYVLDGGTVTTARCRETGVSFPLKKDFAACTIDVDLPAKRATQHFRWAWQDASDRRQFASDCAPDPELVFAVTETAQGCDTVIDYANGRATPQARLVYNNRLGQPVEARGCAASETRAAVVLAADTGDCEATIDLKAGSVAEMASYSYRLDNEVRQASDCRPTGRSFDLAQDYTACEALIDLDGRTATDRVRVTYVDGNGDLRIAADCAPDPARRFAITEAFAGCDVVVDYAAATATPHAKLIWQDASRRRVEVRDCAPATTKRAVSLVADKAGCEMRLDVPALRIHEQAAYSYSLDGGRHEASRCRDTGTSFALVKDYAGCPDDVDLRGRKVTTNARWSWVDAGQRPQPAGECAAEPDLELAITEDLNACRTVIDYEGLTATPQARLVYTDRNSQIIEARGCAAATSKPAVRLVADTGDCEASIDLKAGSVAETASYSYRLDNEVRQASDCRATGRTFDLAQDYTACETLIDLDGRTATDRVRVTYVDGNGDLQIAADCAPDPARRFAITEEFAGCDVAVDYAAATATPLAKLVWLDATRRRVEVRDCAPATTKRAVSLTADSSATARCGRT